MEEITCLVDKHHGPEPYFEFGDEFKNKVIYRAKPTRVVNDVTQKTHELLRTNGLLNRVYPQAIEMSAPVTLTKWLPFAVIALFLALSFMLFYFAVDFATTSSTLSAVAATLCIALGLMGLLGLLATWMIYRIAMWSPPDRPILFNRKTREVTAFHVGLPHFFKVWKGPNTYLTTCPWEDIKVRTYRQVMASANMVTARREMCLLWGKPDNPKQLQDFATLGTMTNFLDDVLFPPWEHVRRYMQEDGPPIQPGESLGQGYDWPNPFPQNIIEAAGGQPYSREKVQAMAQSSASR